MSEDNRIEVDARIHEIEEDNDQYIDAIHYFGVIRNMVTRFVHLHQELLQEAGNTLVRADMPTDNMCYHSLMEMTIVINFLQSDRYMDKVPKLFQLESVSLHTQT